MSPIRNRATRLFGTAVLASCLGIGGAMTGAFALTEQEAQDIAVEAYLYFYPTVSLDVTRTQFTIRCRWTARAGPVQDGIGDRRTDPIQSRTHRLEDLS